MRWLQVLAWRVELAHRKAARCPLLVLARRFRLPAWWPRIACTKLARLSSAICTKLARVSARSAPSLRGYRRDLRYGCAVVVRDLCGEHDLRWGSLWQFGEMARLKVGRSLSWGLVLS